MADYSWQTIIFSGETEQEATAAFDAWSGPYTPPSGMGARRPPRESVNRALDYHLTHVRGPERYEIHVTAWLPVEEP